MMKLFEINTYAHDLNIILHIGFGVIAITLVIIQLFTQKGGASHRRVGRVFLACYAIIICTATLGSIFFNFRAFLVVLTITSAYSCVSGVRVLRLKGQRPRAFDNLIALLGIFSCVAYVVIIEHFQYPVSKVTIYSTLGALTTYCTYDLLRNLMSVNWLTRAWLNEHIVKMFAASSALLSAASGNLFPSYGAYAQLLPSFIGLALTIYFIVSIRRSDNRLRPNVSAE